MVCHPRLPDINLSLVLDHCICEYFCDAVDQQFQHTFALMQHFGTKGFVLQRKGLYMFVNLFA